MKIAIGIVTVGRAELLRMMVERLQFQSRLADGIFICPVSAQDVEGLSFDGRNLHKISSARGISKQRNAIIRAAKDFDIIVFFDDDFVAHNDYLQSIEAEFIQHKQTVIVTGNVISDGARNSGISFDDALNQLFDTDNISSKDRRKVLSAYGCNMAIRTSAIFENNVFFDEKLPLYSWLEDMDFTTRIAKHGDSMMVNNACGVHMGHKGGRVSGVQYGYSQISNPLYIAAKGNGFTYFMAVKNCLKNLSKNLIRSLYPEPYIDRKGRLKGNFIALKDLFFSRLDPLRIEKFTMIMPPRYHK